VVQKFSCPIRKHHSLKSWRINNVPVIGLHGALVETERWTGLLGTLRCSGPRNVCLDYL